MSSVSTTLSFTYSFSPRTLVESAKVMQDFNDVATYLAAANIGTNSIKDNTVTEAKIEDGAVSSAKIAALAVTRAKLAALGQQLSSSSGAFVTTSGSAADVSNLSVSITTTGRPVYVCLVPDGTSNTSLVAGEAAAGGGTISFVRASTTIAVISASKSNIQVPPSSYFTLDTPAAGTYTYKVQATSNGTDDVSVSYCKLLVYEL